MTPSTKTVMWDGPMKARIRALKIQEIKQGIQEERLSREPVALTLAGAKAHLEISMANRGLVKSDNIITVQSPVLPNNVVGHKVLHELIKLRDKSLPGMAIWPESFSSFCKGYGSDKVSVPAFTVSKSNHPAWYKSPTFRKEMNNFVDIKPKPLSVVDADLCGIFSEDNGTAVATLMQRGMLSDSGVMFINHQKGRDGQAISFLNDYFHTEGLFDLHSLQDYFGGALTLTLEDKPKDSPEREALFHAVRSSLVPIFYVIEAFKAGYRLELVRLAEYRDRNMKTSKLGVNMLQWFFRFEKLESKKVAEGNSFAAYSSAIREMIKEEKEVLEYQLDAIAKEAYVYSNYVD